MLSQNYRKLCWIRLRTPRYGKHKKLKLQQRPPQLSLCSFVCLFVCLRRKDVVGQHFETTSAMWGQCFDECWLMFAKIRTQKTKAQRTFHACAMIRVFGLQRDQFCSSNKNSIPWHTTLQNTAKRGVPKKPKITYQILSGYQPSNSE
jgi:hypothetical protein